MSWLGVPTAVRLALNTLSAMAIVGTVVWVLWTLALTYGPGIEMSLIRPVQYLQVHSSSCDGRDAILQGVVAKTKYGTREADLILPGGIYATSIGPAGWQRRFRVTPADGGPNQRLGAGESFFAMRIADACGMPITITLEYRSPLTRLRLRQDFGVYTVSPQRVPPALLRPRPDPVVR